MKYNEIYPSERWADKISKFLTQVVEQKPRMYAKTKKRYIDLGCVLLDCAYKIFSILEEDSLVPGESTDEFNDLESSVDNTQVLKDKLSDMVQKLQAVEDFSDTRKSYPTSSYPKPKDKSIVDVPKYSYYETIEYYGQVFKEASIHNFGYTEVNDCAKLLNRWFQTRFLPEIQDPTFNCQIRYLPSWVSSFIIAYGKYYSLSKVDAFKSMLDKWCDKVESGNGGIYTMPYQIYQLDHDFKEGKCQPQDYTIEAVIISDILNSECLFKLMEGEFDGMVLYGQDDVVNVVKDRNPSLLPKIKTRIARRSSLVREIGLTPVGGFDVDE